MEDNAVRYQKYKVFLATFSKEGAIFVNSRMDGNNKEIKSLKNCDHGGTQYVKRLFIVYMICKICLKLNRYLPTIACCIHQNFIYEQ